MKYLRTYESFSGCTQKISDLGEEHLILWEILQDTFDDFNIVQYNLHNDSDKIFAFKDYGRGKHLVIHNIPGSEINALKKAIFELDDRVKEATGKNISIGMVSGANYTLNVYLVDRD